MEGSSQPFIGAVVLTLWIGAYALIFGVFLLVLAFQLNSSGKRNCGRHRPLLVGESSNELTYMLPWESLADRETRWTAFQNDPAWHKVRDDSERDGPIVASISNQILTPTPFSALK